VAPDGPAFSWAKDKNRGVTFRVFLITALFLPQMYAAGAATAEAPTAGIHRFLQVNDHIYRGAQPSSQGIHTLARRGVRAIVDLRGYGDGADREKKEAESLGIKFYSVPMPPLNAPSEAAISKVLGLLDDSQNWPVFIHCEHGKDRTGTVVACYRMRHDHWPNRRAFMEAEDHGLSRFERGMRSFILRYHATPDQPILAATKP
jgi:tyrosine-protein phosphatase SIW14